MASKYVKKVCNFHSPRKMQIQYYKSNRMAKVKRWKIQNDCKDVEQLVFSYVVGRSLSFPWGEETESKISI